MAGRNGLFVPGPTNVPERVLRAMVVSMEDHRSPKFPKLTLECLAGLKKVFKTDTGTPFIFPSSGTGCWEAALTNTLSPGDKLLIARFGQFSHLWVDMAQRLGFEVEVLECEWGEGAPLDRYRHALEADTGRQIKAVLATHNETATGVTSDVEGIRRAMDSVGHPAFLFVDAVSSLGSIDFRMDEWKVDVCVSGSQKGLMLPAGLGVTCVSEKALEARRSSSKQPRCYFDYIDMLNQNKNGYFPYTPALPMLYGLKESLKAIEEEGLENIFKRHHYLASGVRAAVHEGWGLKVCAKKPEWYSDTVSAIVLPEGIDAAKVIDRAFRRYNLSLGAGLSKVAGKVFRIGHLGDCNELMMLSAIGGAELAMLDCGVPIEPGSGIAAAQRWWRANEALASGTTGGCEMAAQRVVFLDRLSLKANVRRPAQAESYVEHDKTSVDELPAKLADATVAITNKVPLRGATLEQLRQLKMIAVAATGYDVIDVPYCKAHGISVANIRNYAVHTVPEHAFALILALRRSILAYRADVEAGVWQQSEQFCFFTHPIGDLHGSTLGIVGEGAIGQGTAAVARGFGMKVLFADHEPPKMPGVDFTPLDQVLAESDVISLHCPLTPATRNLIGLEQMRRMKRTALLINTSRGGLVDEAALIQALDEGLIAGAGFDVLTTEPPRDGHPLLDVRRPNFILTPHVAWASDGAMQFLADQLIDNIDAWAAGQPQHLVT